MADIPYGISYWHDQRSRTGLHGDDLNSMLQKSIRRSLTENAVTAAFEMYITSPEYLEMLWRRLICISVEDVGFGDPDAVSLITTLSEIRKEFPYNDPDQALFFVHAIRYLCRCKKERTSDHIRGLLRRVFDRGYVPVIPDYALDMHTTKGRSMGRGKMHFAMEASHIDNPLDDEESHAIAEAYLKFCEEEPQMTGRSANEAFTTNAWQY